MTNYCEAETYKIMEAPPASVHAPYVRPSFSVPIKKEFVEILNPRYIL
jgi:hypothetical protein